MAADDGLVLLARPMGRSRPPEAAGSARPLEASPEAGGGRAVVHRRDAAAWPACRPISATDADDGEDRQWSFVHAGQWLGEILAKMRSPENLAAGNVGRRDFKATLRKYQETGVEWLRFLSSLGLGACLADDMGLGKTIQVLALLLALKEQTGAQAVAAWCCRRRCWPTGRRRWPGSRRRCGPCSSIRPRRPRKRLDRVAAEPGRALRDVDVVVTTYGMLLRQPWLLNDALAVGRARRGPGHQEPRRTADEDGQAAQGRRTDRADRHAGRKPAVGPLVAVRFSVSGPAGLASQVQGVRQAAGRAAGEPLRAAAEPGAAVHPAAAEDRPPHHRRPAREGRGPGVLRAEQAAGGDVRQDGQGTGRRAWKASTA